MTVLDVELCAKIPNGEVICRGFVVVVVTFVEPNGEFFTSPNVDVAKGEVVELLVPKVGPVFVVTNGVLLEVAVVSAAVPVAVPNVGFEKDAVLVVSNCEVAVAKGLVVVEDIVPNGEAVEVDMIGVVL